MWECQRMSVKKKKISKAATTARSKNITDFNEDVASGRTLPGSLKHGAYSKHMARKYSDGRHREAKRLNAILDDLTEDLGGPASLNAAQRSHLRNASIRLKVILCISDFVDKEGTIINSEGILLPALGKNLTTYLEGLRRDIEALYGQVGKVSKVPSLDDWISAQNKEAKDD